MRFLRRGASLKAKVNGLLLLAVVGAIAPVGMVLWLAGQFQRTIATIQVENIAPLENLHRVEEFIREVELRIPGVMADWFSGPGAKAYVDASLPQVRILWAEISSRTYKAERAAIVKDFDEAFKRFEALLPRLLVALSKEDNPALAALGDEWLDLKPKLLKPLVALVTIAREDTAREVTAHNHRLRLATGLIVAGLTALTLVLVSVTVSIRRGISPLQNTVRLLGDLAQGQGDLTTRLDAGRRDEIGELARGFNTFMDKLHDIVSHVKLTAVSIATASAQVAAATARLSSTSQEQALGLEETAATLEEITATVRQNAESARQANELAVGSQEAAQTGGQVVTAAVTSMQELTHSSRRIVDVTAVIDDMAFQTNLLALNAAVEAARAGDQGRGFAVVAAEVRSLAQRSAVASKEIKALIQDSVVRTEGGAVLVGRSGQALDKIVDSVKRVTTVIAEIAAASQEQSLGIAQVGQAVAQMDETVQENAAQTEELSSAAQMLAGQARDLEALVGKFKLGDGRVAPVAGTLRAAGHELAPSKAPIVRPAARRTKAVLAGVRVEAGAGHGNGVGVEEF